ncbi:hypothetical protein HIM_10297 [Hirsutella minnesotensis 3608]|uniref:Uncharacterized protein n=1 Tax=Hirsutella minnesotensis 3608 TaxID=1043627 RepID=A0A0F8A2G3_9HYPO|nr:hypothetical protein HIM_10297 [Hirsutella minnesotensis 3608]
MRPRLPRFLILDEPIPSSERFRLLGSFVYDYNAPLDRFAPTTLPEFISNHVIEYGPRTAASLVLQNQQSESVKAKLEQIFLLSASQSAASRYNIASDVVKTYRLLDQDTAFDALMASSEIKEQVYALFRRPGHRTNKVYMIVGLKTLLDARATREWGGGKGREAKAHAPVQATLAAAGASTGKVADTGVEFQANADISMSAGAKHPGEQIFAIEYRVIRRSFLSKLDRSRPDVTYGSIKYWGWGEGVMAGESESEEDDSEDEGSETRLPALRQSEVDGSGGVLWEVADA